MAERYCQKTVETSQPPLNVLPVFIITEQTVLVQSVYVYALFTPCAHFNIVLMPFNEKLNHRFLGQNTMVKSGVKEVILTSLPAQWPI